MTIIGTTRLLGILGDPVSHTLSPAMHNLALSTLGLDYCYLPFRVPADHLPAAVRGLVALGAAGFNATIPHKEALVPLMDERSVEVHAVGAVNTVVIAPNGRLTGYNTDVAGFVTALRETGWHPPTGGMALLLGAGGAARAVLVGLQQLGLTRVVVVNRHPERAARLVADFRSRFPELELQSLPWEENALPLEACCLLVNTTSLGLRNETLPGIELSRLPAQAVVHDCVYRGTGPTPLVRQAAERGLLAIGGLPMLIHQAARAFEIWTGQKMPVAIIQDVFDQLPRPPT